MKSGRNGKLAICAIAVGAVALAFFCCRPAAIEAVYPIENLRLTLTRRVWPAVAGVFSGSAAKCENVTLRRRISELELGLGEVGRLRRENARLRRALDYAERREGRWLPAPVLSSGGGAAGVRDILRVCRGSLSGVREGAVVVVPEGLVGQVKAVTPHTAEVALLTDPDVRVSCEIAAPAAGGRLRGVLSGGGGDALLLRCLRSAETFPAGTKVMTSGLGGVFPRGLEVGTLQSLTNRVRGVEGAVRPSVDFSTLEDVFIRHDN